MEILLSGVVGSVAYGLATPDSDVDRLGIYAEDTVKFHGLYMPIDKKASKVKNGPDADDVTLHEARKYAQLALQCNPTVLELMWLPHELYEHTHDLGYSLIELRYQFLSAKRVRDAYFGYAVQQFTRLERREEKEAGSGFSSDTKKRTAKHARHLMRLLHQGLFLYKTGLLHIRLSPDRVEKIRNFGERVAEGNVDIAKRVLASYESAFNEVNTVLPEQPNIEEVERWLIAVRRHFL